MRGLSRQEGKWNFSVRVECVDRKKNSKREGNLSHGRYASCSVVTLKYGEQTGLDTLVVYIVNNEEDVRQS